MEDRDAELLRLHRALVACSVANDKSADRASRLIERIAKCHAATIAGLYVQVRALAIMVGADDGATGLEAELARALHDSILILTGGAPPV